VGAFLLRRLLQGALVALAAATATFALISVAPGDPMAAILEAQTIDEATREQWRAQWALDRSPTQRYVAWLGGLLRGDPGPSVALGRPIAAALRSALPASALLMGSAIALSLLLGVGIALLQARHAGGRRDRTLGALTLLGVAAPEAGVAFLLLGVVAVSWGLLPTSGAQSIDAAQWTWWARTTDLLAHLLLPLLTLTVSGAAVVARHQRAALLAVAPEDFVTLWRARGLPERQLWTQVILRHAAAPLVTLLGLALPALVGGAVLVERIFAWPGMGTLIVTGVARRDAPLVASSVALSAVLVVAGSTLADLLQRWLDPRLRTPDV
jgi:peptide/nickel transport system permease protein